MTFEGSGEQQQQHDCSHTFLLDWKEAVTEYSKCYHRAGPSSTPPSGTLVYRRKCLTLHYCRPPLGADNARDTAFTIKQCTYTTPFNSAFPNALKIIIIFIIYLWNPSSLLSTGKYSQSHRAMVSVCRLRWCSSAPHPPPCPDMPVKNLKVGVCMCMLTLRKGEEKLVWVTLLLE